MKSDYILALDIGAGGMKLGQFAPLRSGGVQMVNFAHASLDLDPAQDADRSVFLAATLKQMAAEHGIAPGPLLVSVAGQSVFTRFVKLPLVESAKVRKIIEYEASQNVPFPIDEVVWDYQLIGRGAEQLDVLLAAIKADIVEDVAASIEAAGFSPALVDVAPMALYNAVRYNVGPKEGCLLILDMGARSTDLIFMEEGRLFMRSIPVAGRSITQHIMREFDMSFEDAEELKKTHAFVALGGAYDKPASEVADKVSMSVRSVMTRMHAEINRSINFYRSQQGGSKPQQVLLTGGTSIIPQTDAFLKNKLGVDVDYFNPFQNIAVGQDISNELIGRTAHLLGQVVGLGLRRVISCPIELDLLPASIRQERRFRRRQPLFLASAAAVVLTVAAWGGYYYRMGQTYSQELDEVAREVRQLDAVEGRLRRIEGDIRRLQRDAEILFTVTNERAQWPTVVNSIRAVLPEGMWLVSLDPVYEGTPMGDEPGAARSAAARARRPGTRDRPDAGARDRPIVALEVRGRGFLDKVPNAAPIIQFRDRLRASELFTDQTEILLQPAPARDAVEREFTLRIHLKDPIEL